MLFISRKIQSIPSANSTTGITVAGSAKTDLRKSEEPPWRDGQPARLMRIVFRIVVVALATGCLVASSSCGGGEEAPGFTTSPPSAARPQPQGKGLPDQKPGQVGTPSAPPRADAPRRPAILSPRSQQALGRFQACLARNGQSRTRGIRRCKRSLPPPLKRYIGCVMRARGEVTALRSCTERALSR